MKVQFTHLNSAAASAAAPIACTHNHALVHNPFAWREPKQEKQEAKSAE